MLKILNKKTGGVEKVEEVMDALKDQMDEVEGLTRIIGEGGAQANEGEVEEELEDMLREEEKQDMVDFNIRRIEAAKTRSSEADISKSLEGLNLRDGENRRERQRGNAIPLQVS